MQLGEHLRDGEQVGALLAALTVDAVAAALVFRLATADSRGTSVSL